LAASQSRHKPGKATIAFLPPIAPGLDKKTFLKLLESLIETAAADLISEALAASPALKPDLRKSGASARTSRKDYKPD